MTNKQIATKWHEQEKQQGHTKNVFFEGKAIYSYGYHFPMAYITPRTYKGKQIVLQNADDYSNSTSRHLNYMRYACYYDATIEVPTTILKSMIDSFEYNEHLNKDKAIEAIQKRIAYNEAKKARATLRKDTWQYLIDKDEKQLEVLQAL